MQPSPRFAVYIDGVKVTDSEDVDPFYTDPIKVRGQAAGHILSALYAVEQILSLDLPNAWYADHRLRFGTLGMRNYDGGYQMWEGDVDMFAVYGRPLTEAEVQANYAAKVDNSYPVAYLSLIHI